MKLVSFGLGLVVGCSVVASTMAQGNATVPIIDSGDNTIAYFSYFSDSDCQDFAGLKAFLANDPFEILNAPRNANGDDIACVDAMACLYQPEGKTCRALGVEGKVTTTTIDVREDGVYECDESNINLGLPECSLLDSNACYQSSAFNCHFRVAKAEQYKESPNEFIPPAKNLDGLDQYGFKVYYDDDDCTNLVAIRGYVNDNPYNLQRAGEGQEYSCTEEMSCFLFEDGFSCEALDLTGAVSTSNLNVKGDNLFECDTSNQEVNEDLCDVIDPFACKASSVFKCNFHLRSSIFFAKDPAATLKPGFGGASAIDGEANQNPLEGSKLPDSLTEAPMATEAPTSSSVTAKVLGARLSLFLLLGLML
ncbi:MAG: hypothetical protein SGARI_004023 [Bacillariaceae sp.]